MMKISLPIIRLFKLSIFSMLFVLSNEAFGQLIAVPLEQRIDNANAIFEGKVTSKTSFWNDAHTQIYTSNVVSVYKVFKGKYIAGEAEIITQGGAVGRDMEQVTHSLQLNIGDVGIFTAIPNTVTLSQNSRLTRFSAYAGLQGFIKYNLQKHSASDPFTEYKSIPGDVYPAITKRTKASITTIKRADYKIQ